MSAPAPARSFCGLRHGATDWNRQGLFQGRTDNPLNADGLAQAHEAADMLRGIGIGRIVASPLVRAARTAEIIADAISVPLSRSTTASSSSISEALRASLSATS